LNKVHFQKEAYLTRRVISFLSLIFAIIAAIFVVPPALRTLSVARLTLSSQPDFALTPEKVITPNSNTSDAITVLAVTEKENSVVSSLQAHPMDPATLTDLPDYAAMDFGHHYTYAVSPNYKNLAVITWPRDSNQGGVLHLIDLNTWTDTPTNLSIDEHVNELTFGEEGKTLYWTMPTVYDPAHGMPSHYKLYQYDLENRQLSVITSLPFSFIPWSQRFSSGNLIIFGIPTDSDNLAEDTPHLLFIDPTEKRIVADQRLDGVKAGQFREPVTEATPSAQEGSWQYVMYHPGLAWDLDRKVLFIVNADDYKITMVDLVSGSILKQTQARPRQSLLEWVSDSFVPAVEAKGGPWLGARVLLSGDGERLYVFREKTEMGISMPVDLRVIATDGMHEIAHLNELLTVFTLTPDGKSLLVVKGEIDNSYGFDALVSRDVYILDAESLRERIHIRIDEVDQLVLDGFSPDGHYAYLRGSSAEWIEGSGWRNGRTVWQSLDLNSYRLLSAGESESMFGALLHVGP
jgi:hypothetical protein